METPFYPLLVYGDMFWRSMAHNSIVLGLIWPKFEFIQDIMHIFVAYKSKMDRIKSVDF